MDERADDDYFVREADEAQEPISDKRAKSELDERDEEQAPRVHDFFKTSGGEHETYADKRKWRGGSGNIFNTGGDDVWELDMEKKD